MTRRHTFTATIDIAGINPFILVPPRIVIALGDAPKLRVLVRVNAARPDGRSDRAVRPPRGPVKNAARLIAIGRLTPDTWFRTTPREAAIRHTAVPRSVDA